MVELPFLIPGSQTEYVKYEVGQPMGALSSWGIMALTHHVIVQYSALEVGCYPFKDYILLGDDIVINNDSVATKYREVMTYLGIDISEHKTHVSYEMYEFAKRWFKSGKEITGLPLGGFIDNFNNPILMVSQILDQIRKGNGPRLLGVRVHNLLEYLYKDSMHLVKGRSRSKWIQSAVHRAENFCLLQKLCHEFNYDEARLWVGRFLPGDAIIHPSERDLKKFLEGVLQMALLNTLQGTKVSLLSMTQKFVEQVETLSPSFKEIPEDQRYQYYGKMHIFLASMLALDEQNKDDILLTDLHDVDKVLESIIVPNMETSFTKRKSIIMVESFDSLVKKTITVIKTGFGDSTGMMRGQAASLGSAWTNAIDDFSSLVLSPKDLEIRRMNSQGWW